ncbi:MAG: glycosyltransferase family 39 protein [Candidatus Pacebacteria bacterium]|nr:glycosyltransferase family 39 protein [Candidatus Paceibacterota bacterium]
MAKTTNRSFRLPAAKMPLADHYGWSSVLILVLSIMAVRLLMIAGANISLYGDEAQYWLWGKSLEFGYFSKPPMVAWLIRLTSSIFGDQEFGVRMGAPVVQAVTALILYAAAREIFRGQERASLAAHRTALVYSLMPGVMVSGLVISTDVPLLCFWSLALLFVLRARRSNHWRDWLGLGLALGLGLLSKYSMGLFILSLLIAAVVVREELSDNGAENGLRQTNHLTLKNSRLWLAIGLGLLVYSPNLVWNIQHQMVSFRHTASNAGTIGLQLHPGHMGEFLLGQLAIFGPISFILLLILIATGMRRRKPQNAPPNPRLAVGTARFLVIFIAPPLIFAMGVALLNRANINWAAASYSAASLWLGWYFAVEFKDRPLFPRARLRYWLWVSVVILGTMVGVTAGYYREIMQQLGIELTRRNDPLVRLGDGQRLGDAVLAQLLAEAKTSGTIPILATDDRMIFATLAFYIRPPVAQVQFQSGPRPTDHFQMTNPMSGQRDAPMIFIARPEVLSGYNPSTSAREAMEVPEVLGYFAKHEAAGAITIPIHADYILYYRLYHLQHYLGEH